MRAFYRGCNVLVTGSDGFIGSFLVERLVSLGAIVHAVVRPTSNTWRLKPLAEQITILEVDFNNQEKVSTMMSTCTPTLVFNLASTTQTTQDFSLLDTILPATFGIAETVTRAALGASVERFVQLGTIEEYGSGHVPFIETAHEEPISPYSLGKSMSTDLVLLAGKLSPMEVVALRAAPVFGPSQTPGMLISSLIRAGLMGTDFPMNPGEQLRDFIYVEDLVEGILKAGAEPKAAGEIINLGSGRGQKVRDVAEMVNKAMGGTIKITFGANPYRPNDTMEFYMNCDKAKTLLSWTPETAIMDGITKTVAWYREHYQDIPQTQ